MRIAPNHISISDPDALHSVYAHGNGVLKSNFYDAFVSIGRGVFNTRDRAEHARKRKLISHIFSPKSVLEFEPHVRFHVGALINQWDRLCSMAENGLTGPEGEGGWTGRNGLLWLDCLPCTCLEKSLHCPRRDSNLGNKGLTTLLSTSLVCRLRSSIS